MGGTCNKHNTYISHFMKEVHLIITDHLTNTTNYSLNANRISTYEYRLQQSTFKL